MKQRGHALAGIFIVLGLSALLGIVGCTYSQTQVIPVSSRDVAALSADDIARVMLRTGFSHEQILELGTDLRNGLSSFGTSQIMIEDRIQAIFAVEGDCVYVTAYKRGSFIYDMKTGRIRSF